MPPFLSGPLFSPPQPLAGPTSKKIQNYFFKILLKVLYVVFSLVFITGLGMEIGHRQQKLWRKPSLQSSANPAVYYSQIPHKKSGDKKNKVYVCKKLNKQSAGLLFLSLSPYKQLSNCKTLQPRISITTRPFLDFKMSYNFFSDDIDIN